MVVVEVESWVGVTVVEVKEEAQEEAEVIEEAEESDKEDDGDVLSFDVSDSGHGKWKGWLLLLLIGREIMVKVVEVEI